MAGFSSSQSDLHLGKTDSELLPGSSGGAVLDETGRLVGVITAAHTDQRTQGRLSYFVLLNEAKEVIGEAQAAPRPDPQIDWMVDISDELLE
jgi:S1-C subfamily serine protease